MKVILGLGNAEAKYSGTRHNVGFWLADHLASHYDTSFKPQAKLHALVAEATVGEERILIVKPTTYYNEVGRSARAILDFYKLTPADFLILHDDLALPLGTIRTRIGGSDGGNNGLKSLASHVGLDTNRLRIGVWTDQHHGIDKVQTVLGKFTLEEQSALDDLRPQLQAITGQFIDGSFETTTHKN